MSSFSLGDGQGINAGRIGSSLDVNPRAFKVRGQQNSQNISSRDRDIVIRTVIGEAGGEGDVGMAAVAHVIRNRSMAKGFPNTPGAVSMQRGQFSIWNGVTGYTAGTSASERGRYNALLNRYNPGDALYERVGGIVDQVFSGETPDPTGRAVNYYAPRGMPGGRAPSWWNKRVRAAGGVVEIGNHRFAGNPELTGEWRSANIASSETVEVDGVKYSLGFGGAFGSNSSGNNTGNNSQPSTTQEDDPYVTMAATTPADDSDRSDLLLLLQRMQSAQERRNQRTDFLREGFGFV